MANPLYRTFYKLPAVALLFGVGPLCLGMEYTAGVFRQVHYGC